MEPKDALGSWFAANRAFVGLLGLALVFLVAALVLARHARPDITNPMGRANCERLYQGANNRAESLAVDAQPASVRPERKLGYLRPDVRCGEVRVYDSARAR